MEHPEKVDISSRVRVADIRQRVDHLLLEQRRTAKWLYDAIEMSKVGYKQMWERETVKLITLQAIADHLKVSLLYLLYGVKSLPSSPSPVGTPLMSQHVEGRLEQVERKIRQLETQLKKR